MNTELTQQAPIMETQISNSKELTSTSMKPLEGDMCLDASLWIWSLEQWTRLELDPSVNYSDPITLCSDRVELETTGLKDTIQKAPSSLTQF